MEGITWIDKIFNPIVVSGPPFLPSNHPDLFNNYPQSQQVLFSMIVTFSSLQYPFSMSSKRSCFSSCHRHNCRKQPIASKTVLQRLQRHQLSRIPAFSASCVWPGFVFHNWDKPFGRNASPAVRNSYSIFSFDEIFCRFIVLPFSIRSSWHIFFHGKGKKLACINAHFRFACFFGLSVLIFLAFCIMCKNDWGSCC